jgi:hypothetical protein
MRSARAGGAAYRAGSSLGSEIENRLEPVRKSGLIYTMRAVAWVGIIYFFDQVNYCTRTGSAGIGHLSVLQWAWANGCDWDFLTCYAVAGGGHLEVL